MNVNRLPLLNQLLPWLCRHLHWLHALNESPKCHQQARDLCKAKSSFTLARGWVLLFEHRSVCSPYPRLPRHSPRKCANRSSFLCFLTAGISHPSVPTEVSLKLNAPQWFPNRFSFLIATQETWLSVGSTFHFVRNGLSNITERASLVLMETGSLSARLSFPSFCSPFLLSSCFSCLFST